MMINLKHFFQCLSAILLYFFSSFTLSLSTTLSLFSEQMQHHLLLLSSIFPGGSGSKSICLKCGRPGFDSWVRKIPWRRKWQPTPILLPGKIPWMEEPGGLQSMGSQRVGHDWVTSLSFLLSFFPPFLTAQSFYPLSLLTNRGMLRFFPKSVAPRNTPCYFFIPHRPYLIRHQILFILPHE